MEACPRATRRIMCSRSKPATRSDFRELSLRLLWGKIALGRARDLSPVGASSDSPARQCHVEVKEGTNPVGTAQVLTLAPNQILFRETPFYCAITGLP